MTVKFIEIRDRGTTIVAMAVHLSVNESDVSGPEFWMLRRAGYAKAQITKLRCPSCEGHGGFLENPCAACKGDGFFCEHQPYIILVKLDAVEAHYDSFDWPNQRTMGWAHRWIVEYWPTIASGDVVDVEFLRGESTAPKISERELGV